MNPNYYIPWVAVLLASLDLVVFARMYVLLGRSRYRDYARGFLVAWTLFAVIFCAVAGYHNIMLGSTRNPVPRFLVAVQYIWHFLFLPALAIGLLVELAVELFWRLARRVKMWSRSVSAVKPAEETSVPARGFSRRHFLTTAALVTAPVATAGLAGVSLSQIGKFRLRTFDVALQGLPAALENYSITVIADIHVGVFSTAKMLEDIVEASNRLGSDLVLLPGDLINIWHGDLPAALDMVVQLRSRDGVYLIEGNHDAVQGHGEFDWMVRQRGVNILVDEMAVIQTRGTSFQLLGTRWLPDDVSRDASVTYTAGLRDPQVFSIMMAHHPNSWDAAAACGIPLVIAGHTHGGQIMLTRNIGGGPLRFRYWTGRYDRPGSTLIVSNGVGNWFPLRVGAPAEILRINLHSA